MSNKKIWGKRGLLIFSLIFVVTISFFSIINRKNIDNEFNNGSNIKLENLNDNKIESLNKLCKVWGFVKYHHPKVVSGSLNWDYELFRVMPKVIEAKDASEVDEILYNWINELGEVQEGIYYNNNYDVMVEADIDWIKDNQYVNKDLSDLLVKLSKTYILKRDKAYVNFTNDSILSAFENEEIYSDMKFDDDGFKILSLFRYWNIIQYYYPYRTVMEEDWNAVLNEFIPKFIECNDEISYKLTVSELTTRIHDSHVAVFDDNEVLFNYWGNKMVPIKFDLVEDKIIITNISEEGKNDSNIQIGDVVLKINDKDIYEVIKEKSKYISFSNEKAIVNGLEGFLFRTSDDSLTLTLERDGKELKEKVKCYNNIAGFKKDSHELLEGNIGYINPGALEKGEIDKIIDKFNNTEGMIIDLRNYPSEVITYILGNYIVDKKVNFVKLTIANRSVPGEFIFTEDAEVGNDNVNYYKGKVIIIINEGTQSQGEFAAMSFRNAPNAKVMGNNSIGADGELVLFNLPGGITTSMTGMGVYNPDKSETQRVGVAPDIYMKPTIQGIREGRDELLEKAVELIND